MIIWFNPLVVFKHGINRRAVDLIDAASRSGEISLSIVFIDRGCVPADYGNVKFVGTPSLTGRRFRPLNEFLYFIYGIFFFFTNFLKAEKVIFSHQSPSSVLIGLFAVLFNKKAVYEIRDILPYSLPAKLRIFQGIFLRLDRFLMSNCAAVVTNLPNLGGYLKEQKCKNRLLIYTHVDSVINSQSMVLPRMVDMSEEISFVIPSFGRTKDRDRGYLDELNFFVELVKRKSHIFTIRVLAFSEGDYEGELPALENVRWEIIPPIENRDYLKLLENTNGVISLALQHKGAHRFGIDIYRFPDCVCSGIQGFASWIADASYYGYSDFELGYFFGGRVANEAEYIARAQLAFDRREELVGLLSEV